MYDKDLIEKVCNLNCSKDEVCISQTIINYDIEYPFIKYYNVNIIIDALNKYSIISYSEKFYYSELYDLKNL